MSKQLTVLGFSGSTHSPAAALISGGKVQAAVEQERISRNKHARGELPLQAAQAVLSEAGMEPSDVDVVSFFLDPACFDAEVRKHVFRHWRRYVMHPVSYRTRRFLRRGERYRTEAEAVVDALGIRAPLEYTRHHDSHAASAFFLSPFDEAVILTLDNMGELDSGAVAIGRGLEVETLTTQRIPHSLGMLYAAFTDYLGFRAWDEEGKVMALAAYGTPLCSPDEILEMGDGYYRVRETYQMVETRGHCRLYKRGLVRRFGSPRVRDSAVTQRHMDVAATVQAGIEEAAIRLAAWAHAQTGIENYCLAGGVAQNCKMNGVIGALPFVRRLYVTPAPGDAGTSVGCAAWTYVMHERARPVPLLHAGLGREFCDEKVEDTLALSGLDFVRVDDPAAAALYALSRHSVIAWFQGRAEFGPRALGHRSILAMPGVDGIREYVNAHVKQREWWRPLCPSVLGSEVEAYFAGASGSRFMNVAYRSHGDVETRLPAVFHVDGTARVQATFGEESDAFARLLGQVGRETGDPILLNTSFNRRGEPIVDSPDDAIRSFLAMPIQAMVIGSFLVEKESK